MGDAGDPLDPLGRLMLAFDGHELPDDVGRRFATAPAAGMTLFRFFNSGSPAQVRELTRPSSGRRRRSTRARRPC